MNPKREKLTKFINWLAANAGLKMVNMGTILIVWANTPRGRS